MNEPALAKAVVKTMKILECLSHDRSFGITELAARVSANGNSLRMNKSTVYRFLTSLKELGFVRQDPDTDRYSLTLKLFEIGMSVLDRLELWREAQPIIKEVARLTGETVHLATLDAGSLVYLGKIESARTLRVSMMSRVGQSAPTYCTGLGKALLAQLSAEHVSEILGREKVVRYTSRTLTRRSDLDRELASIREKGYAFDNEEHEVGVRCLAAPIRDNKGTVCAAVSVSVPTVRLPDREIPQYCDIVLRAAEEISLRMGFRAARSPRGTTRRAAKGGPRKSTPKRRLGASSRRAARASQ
jgi:IclR family KDG regulon transcriptional repressor